MAISASSSLKTHFKLTNTRNSGGVAENQGSIYVTRKIREEYTPSYQYLIKEIKEQVF